MSSSASARGRITGERVPDYPPKRQTGQAAPPVWAYRTAASRSCSATGAAAGSPLPPIAAQVAGSNWYLPRYRPSGETASGWLRDSHQAIDASRAETSPPEPTAPEGAVEGALLGAYAAAAPTALLRLEPVEIAVCLRQSGASGAQDALGPLVDHGRAGERHLGLGAVGEQHLAYAGDPAAGGDEVEDDLLVGLLDPLQLLVAGERPRQAAARQQQLRKVGWRGLPVDRHQARGEAPLGHPPLDDGRAQGGRVGPHLRGEGRQARPRAGIGGARHAGAAVQAEHLGLELADGRALRAHRFEADRRRARAPGSGAGRDQHGRDQPEGRPTGWGWR